MQKLVYAVALIAALGFSSCASSEFAGETGIKKAEKTAGKGKGASNDQDANVNTDTDKPNGGVDGNDGGGTGSGTGSGSDAGSDAGSDVDGGGGEDEGKLDIGEDAAGGADTTGDTADGAGGGGGSSGPGILDILGGLFKALKDVEVKTNDNEIVFGGQRVFHIGDDNFDGSSCKFQINAYPLTGKTYFFEFEVMNDDTQINISINKVCGVDYGDSNFVGLKQGNTSITEQGVPANAAQIVLPGQKLNKGLYQIAVESRRGAAQNPNDNDDYIVGLVTIKGDKQIKPGKVGTKN